MPPRSSLTSSFSITDSNNEVVCPLRNQDGSSCRKRCIGEKRYRSMQEHIRRAHPEHYISKLPATEESFLLMINTPPSERRPLDQTSAPNAQGFHERHNYHRDESSNPGTPRLLDDFSNGGPVTGPMLGTASAAAALAELHGVKSERDMDLDGEYYSDMDVRRRPRTSIELPPLNLSNHDITSDPYSSAKSNRQRDFLPSILANSPPGRSSTLPPLQRSVGPNRPRKQSVTKRGREPHHKKKNSKGSATDWLRRIQNEERYRPGNDRKALSAEPSADFGKRWEDLIDAADQAASAAGDIDEDRTPVPQSPVSMHRSSLPPFSLVLEGGNLFEKVHGMPAYQYKSLNPENAKRHDTAMTNLSKIIMKKILERYNGFQGVTTLVDVGGGYGVTLNMIISKYPSIKGINYELPHVVQEAPSFPGIEHVGGDMFSTVPKADTIMMKEVLHNWDDEHCLKLLKNCYEALEEKGKVIVISYMMFEEAEGSNAAKFIYQMDLYMATQFGAKQRAEKQFKSMAMDAGFSSFQLKCLVFNVVAVMELHK